MRFEIGQSINNLSTGDFKKIQFVETHPGNPKRRIVYVMTDESRYDEESLKNWQSCEEISQTTQDTLSTLEIVFDSVFKINRILEGNYTPGKQVKLIRTILNKTFGKIKELK